MFLKNGGGMYGAEGKIIIMVVSKVGTVGEQELDVLYRLNYLRLGIEVLNTLESQAQYAI